MQGNPILNSFVAGELSPKLAGRTDLQQYYQSAAEILNMIVECYGGVKKAPGTYFAAEVSDSSKATRIKKFVFSDTQAYVIEIGDLYMRFYKDDGAILETHKDIISVSVATGVITVTSHGYTDGQEIYIDSVVGTTELNGKRYLIDNATTHTFTLTDKDGVAIDTTGYTAYTSGGEASRVYQIATSYPSSIIRELQFAQKEDVLYITHPSYLQSELTRTGHTAWTLTPIDYSTGENRPGLMPENITETTITPSGATGAGITLTASTAIFDVTHIGSIWKVNTGYVKIITVSTGGLKTVCTANVLYSGTLTGTSAYTVWNEASWSGYRGYPKSVTLYENRLVYGYTAGQPQTTWESAIGAYKTFEVGTAADDAMSWKADTNEVEVINWLYPSNEILIGTVSGLHSLGTGSDTTALTPTTARIKKKSNDGASSILPQQIGSYVYYWQKYNRILREYGISSDTFENETKDATILSEHITESGIVEMDYQQAPNNILWCVRADGKLCSFTRQIEQKVSAWALHDTQGFYESVAVIPKDSYDEVWFVVKRIIGGVTKRYIEYMVAPSFTDQEDAFFVHSGLTLNNPKTITDITQADPAVVTCDNDFTDGDIVKISGLVERYQNAIAALALDGFEYSTDYLAQAAYVDDGTYSANKCSGGAASANEATGATTAGMGFSSDDDQWACAPGTVPDWLKYDFGSGVTHVVTKVSIRWVLAAGYTFPGTFKIQGSNDDSGWTDLHSASETSWSDGETKNYTFTNNTAYRYVRIYISAWYDSGAVYGTIVYVQMFTPALRTYSEPTIKTLGLYSMRGLAIATSSLNKTLTHTIASPLDLTGIDTINFDIRANRTGANIKIGIHDSGGTTTEKTYTVIAANTWETVTWDISGVSAANKNVIDSIIITILNADADNTFYLDNMVTISQDAETVGMTELNGNRYIVYARSSSVFSLKDLDGNDIDSTSYTAYDTGGEVREGVSEISGLTHLIGETVQVFTDGAYHPDRTVNVAGKITLDDKYFIISAGLGYTARLKSNDLEAAPGSTNSQGKTKRVSAAVVNIYESLDFEIGTDAKMDAVTVRPVGLATGTVTPLYTGIRRVPFPSGWDTTKQVIVEQDKCLPLHVLSISCDMEAN